MKTWMYDGRQYLPLETLASLLNERREVRFGGQYSHIKRLYCRNGSVAYTLVLASGVEIPRESIRLAVRGQDGIVTLS